MYSTQKWGANEILYNSYCDFFKEHDLVDSNYTKDGFSISQKGIDITDKELKTIIKYGGIDDRLKAYQEKEFNRKIIYAIIGSLAGAIFSNLDRIERLVKCMLNK